MVNTENKRRLDTYLVAMVEKNGGEALTRGNGNVGSDRIVAGPHGYVAWVTYGQNRSMDEAAMNRLRRLNQNVFVFNTREEIDDFIESAFHADP